MAVTTIRFHTKDAEAALRRLRRNAPQVVLRALNRGADGARTQLNRDVSKSLRLKVSDVRARTGVRRASATKLKAVVTADARPIPALAFGARGPEPSRGKGRGVRTKLPSGTLRSAFIATMRSGHRGVFKRRGRARLPIIELHGPSAWHVALKHAGAAGDRAIEQVLKNIRRFITSHLT